MILYLIDQKLATSFPIRIIDSNKINKKVSCCHATHNNFSTFILPFFSLTPQITYIAGYLLTTDDEYSVHHDHIWAVLQCVE